MSTYVLTTSRELYHYGVLGMKWGVRKASKESAIASNVRQTKAAYKTAKKAYNKSFDEAYDKSAAAWSPSKKHRQENDDRWRNAVNKADAVNKAKEAYKSAKRERKEAIRKTTDQLRKESSVADKLIYNDATRRKAAKYVVDNDMSMSEATEKAKGVAWRNTAIYIAAAGAISVASIARNA